MEKDNQLFEYAYVEEPIVEDLKEEVEDGRGVIVIEIF